MSSEHNDRSSSRQLEAKHAQSVKRSQQPQSKLGKASFFLGLTSIFMIVFFGGVLPIGVLLIGDHTDWELPFASILFGTVAPLGFLLAPLVNLIGFSLGVTALIRKAPRKGFAIAGLVLNSLILMFLFVPLLLWWGSAIERMIAL